LGISPPPQAAADFAVDLLESLFFRGLGPVKNGYRRAFLRTLRGSRRERPEVLDRPQSSEVLASKRSTAL
jgi:hypothetical protein